jgi:hypothetical protein
MRWSLRVVLFLAILGGVVLMAQAAIGQGGKPQATAAAKPHVTISSMSEPPDRRAIGTTFSVAFTVVNQGNSRASRRTRVRFYLTKKAGKPRRGDRRLRGSALIGRLGKGQETSRRIRVRIAKGTPQRLWFLVGVAIPTGARKSIEKNNAHVSGQRIRTVPPAGPPTPAPPAGPSQFRVDRTTLPIGRPTVAGVLPNTTTPNPGDAEKSNQRKELFKVGPVSVVADCKRTTNGEAGGPDVAVSGSSSNFDQDGDEAKILVYTDSGTVTFNSMGNSSRRNIGPGEGGPVAGDTNGANAAAQEHTGGEGKHMAIAAARDPEEGNAENDWVTAYKVGSVYVSHSSGTEFVFTGYAAIDTLGIGDNCGFGGVVTVVKA